MACARLQSPVAIALVVGPLARVGLVALQSGRSGHVGTELIAVLPAALLRGGNVRNGF